ncbi:MAG: hypothetical protein IPI77_16255 [Saprospiraceae bacterium]|nr:hypothetical protein [Saprospiraceae bacterium]
MTTSKIQNRNGSSDDLMQKYRTQMGHEFGTVYHALRNEMIGLTFRWKEFEILYSKKSRVDLLNQAAPFFSFVVQKTFWENIILSIAKLTERAKNGEDKSITLLLLFGYIDDRMFLKTLKPLKKNVINYSKFSRVLRNQWIAHKDFGQVTGENGVTLQWPSAKMIKEFLQASYALMNAIEFRYLTSTTGYDLAIHSGGALSLLYTIEAGLRMDQLRLKMAKKGDRSLEDFKSVI